METGPNGAFVIAWSQTVIDGIAAAPYSDLRPGSTWRREGQVLRVDRSEGATLLGAALGTEHLHARAGSVARRMCSTVVPMAPRGRVEVASDQLLDRGFVLTDGKRTYAASRIEPEQGRGALVLFLGDPPPAGQDLWVVRVTTNCRVEARRALPAARGVICFSAGTLVETPVGPRPVEELRPGDMVGTRDDGPRPVIWRGARRLGPADLRLQPHLRPVRIAAGALGGKWTGASLRVSPYHRVLLQGRACQALFGADEVLARACDLLDRTGVSVDLSVESVTYVHLMLERHQVLTTHGLGSESFHPDEADRTGMEPADLGLLHRLCPELQGSPALYGPPARRRLSPAEATILSADNGPISGRFRAIA